jgi:cytochrome c553
MKKVLKWLGIALGGLVLVAAIFYAVVFFRTEARINKTYDVRLQALSLPTDSASLALGRHVATNRGCTGCHGADLAGGRAFFDESTPIGVLYAPNITAGKGGIRYTDKDWIRTLRHGVNPAGRSVWFMPSHEVCHLSNQEMAALIAYAKSFPPVDKTVPAHAIKPLGRMLTFFDQLPLLPAELIDHAKTDYPEVVNLTASVETGKYLATTCQGCHGPRFKGAEAHGPGQPPIPDISSTGKLGSWKADGFVSLFHTGVTPDGRTLSEYMPVKEFTYSDDELRGLYLYLHQVK